LLPTPDRRIEAFRMSEPVELPVIAPGPFNRIVYSAAHVVADPLADIDPTLGCAIDWDATMRHRERLWDLGFGIAEAMDTAQRGMGLDWLTSRELIRRSVAAARARNAPIACGAGTDHLAATPDTTIEQVIAAYEEQVGDIEGLGGRVILMASRALASVARSPEDYARVYGRILSQAREKVILHWLGEMFDPALAGYWGHSDIDTAMETCLGIIARHADKIDGIKISLLDKEREIAMRRRLPSGVSMYTGDDFSFPELIAGDGEGHSEALLGIFDGIAPVASQALSCLADGDRDGYFRLMNPTIPLSRHIFKSPTRFYKTGLVFLAWLNGWQDHFTMVAGQESARSLVHLADLFRRADHACALTNPDLARHRMRLYLETRGVTG
ncbi:MAG TPA: dihydrodipicolinate synthase family protein, partial [Saliniramus sp.]|nr:dihydrodipicolinate synthase family protein [Saliniramus sp.]